MGHTNYHWVSLQKHLVSANWKESVLKVFEGKNLFMLGMFFMVLLDKSSS
jgi:hypothetical protein